jgi:hypothetical protein
MTVDSGWVHPLQRPWHSRLVLLLMPGQVLWRIRQQRLGAEKAFGRDPAPAPAKAKHPRIWLDQTREVGAGVPLDLLLGTGPMPKRWTIDHACGEKNCLDHLECFTRGENLRRRHARERGELRTGHAGPVPPRRAAEETATALSYRSAGGCSP